MTYLPPSIAAFYRYYSTYVVGFAWAIIFFNLTVAILFYSFKKQRTFPASIQAWTLIMDALYFLRELMKWGPNSVLREQLLVNPSIATCRVVFGWEVFVESGQALCNIYMAFTIYNSIVRKQDMSYSVNPNYFRVMVLLFWTYTTVWVLVLSLVPSDFTPSFLFCFPHTYAYNLALLSQWVLALIIEVFFLGSCVFYVREVLKAANSSVTGERRFARLNIIFLCIIFLQWIPRVAWNVDYLLSIMYNDGDKSVDITRVSVLTHFMYACAFVCYLMDGVLVLSSNRHLHRFVFRKYKRIVKFINSKEEFSTTSNSSPQLSARTANDRRSINTPTTIELQ